MLKMRKFLISTLNYSSTTLSEIMTRNLTVPFPLEIWNVFLAIVAVLLILVLEVGYE